MSSARKNFLKQYNTLIKFFLSLLGLGAACGIASCEYGPPPVEYGVPHASFIVNGTVESMEDGQKIPDIKVIMGYDTGYTDTDGKFRVMQDEFPEDQTFLLEFRDIDGTSHGEFQELDTVVDFTDPQFTGGTGSWDQGSTEKELNVKLKAGK